MKYIVGGIEILLGAGKFLREYDILRFQKISKNVNLILDWIWIQFIEPCEFTWRDSSVILYTFSL
jgi:hypothetical protein